MRLGTLVDRTTPKIVIIGVIIGIAVALWASYRAWTRTSVGCVRCHSDRQTLKKYNAEWAYVTEQEVRAQSHHPFIECTDCHLGNGRAKTPEAAHKGMLKMLIVSEEGTLLSRKEGYPGPLQESGDDEMFALMPKVWWKGELYYLTKVRNILWHDRDPKSLGFDPKIAEETCSKSGCHPQELEQFKKTIMGRNFRQRTMRTWLKPYGPHNCGPSFADLPPPEVLTKAGFDYENTEEIARQLNVPFTKEHAELKQKLCNVCHAGCLDCHYAPSKEKGRHAFVKVPGPKSCSGFGRSASTCHPGAMFSRRGETYIGGDYSIPQGMEPDVHYKKGLKCLDCHMVGEKGMGDIQRKATCQDCHIEEEEAAQKGLHKKLLCAACHVRKLGGYQITIWGPGREGSVETPFHKYSLYYGFQEPPIIMKDQTGTWVPMKIWPHSVGNIKVDVPPSPRLMFRWPDGQTRDAYYIIGTFDDLPSDNKHLLWMEIEQAAHPYQKARDCQSCHKSEVQVSYSQWEFFDEDGAKPFKGQHRIVADSKGLRIEDLKNTTPIVPMPGRKLTDFASWVYMKDRWKVPGDFSIKTDRTKYKKYLRIYNQIVSYFSNKEKQAKTKEEKLKLKRQRAMLIHNLLLSEEFFSEGQKK